MPVIRFPGRMGVNEGMVIRHVSKEAFVRDFSNTVRTCFSLRIPAGNGGRTRIRMLLISLLSMTLFAALGCGTMASMYRKSADKAAGKIIEKKQTQLFGSKQKFTIERPSDILRKRLLVAQELPQAGKASLGANNLDKIPFWPEKEYPVSEKSGSDEDGITLEAGKPLVLSLVQTLQIGALNSAEYQTMKENVFQVALDANLQRHEFGFTVDGQVDTELTADNTTGETVRTESSSGSLSLSKTFKSGARFATSVVTTVGVDVVSLLSGDTITTKGITGDASISIPLLRGAGRHIAAEPLTQAEQNLIYALYQLERYKKTFAVEVVSNYLNVLQQSDQVNNAAENYRNLITSTRRTQRLADAGRSTVIQVNQSLQQELTARARWINAIKTQENQLDSFKTSIGLPADANIQLERSELDRLSRQYATMTTALASSTTDDTSESTKLVPPSMAGAGALEMGEGTALKLAFENRLDLRVAEGKIYDAQRAVVIKANALKADVTLLGTAISTNPEDTTLDFNRGILSGLLTIDLPFDRISERNAYRKSYIALDQAVRNVQSLEDTIKLSVRQSLNQMLQTRESVAIQTKAVSVAENQAKSTNMFYEAGRSELRDLLDAQAALLTARNSLSSAVVQYRSAELAFQRDTGVLKIDDKGLLVEYSPRGE